MIKRVFHAFICIMFLFLIFVGTQLTAFAASPDFYIKKMNAAPVLDGTISESEWGAPTYTVTTKMIKDKDPYLGMTGTFPELGEDYSYSVYYGWDDKNLYLAVQSKNAPEHKFSRDDAIKDMWQSECIQFTVDLNAAGSMNSKHGEYSVAANTAFSKVYKYSHYNLMQNREEFPDGGEITDLDAVIKKDEANKGVVYEMRFPWAKIDSSKASTIKENAVIRSGLSMNFEPGFAALCYGRNPIIDKNTFNAPRLTLVASDYVIGDVKLKGIKVDAQNVSIKTGSVTPLIVTFDPINATNKKITFSSNDESVATVDASGNVKALKAGTVIITAHNEDNSISGTLQIKVSGDAAAADDGSQTDSTGAGPKSGTGSDSKRDSPVVWPVIVAVIVVVIAALVILVLKKRKSDTV